MRYGEFGHAIERRWFNPETKNDFTLDEGQSFASAVLHNPNEFDVNLGDITSGREQGEPIDPQRCEDAAKASGWSKVSMSGGTITIEASSKKECRIALKHYERKLRFSTAKVNFGGKELTINHERDIANFLRGDDNA